MREAAAAAAGEPSLNLPKRRSGAEGAAGRHQQSNKKTRWRRHVACVAPSLSLKEEMLREPAARNGPSGARLHTVRGRFGDFVHLSSGRKRQDSPAEEVTVIALT